MGEERYNGNKEMEQLVKGISSCIKGLRLKDVSYDYAFGLTLHFENELMVNIYNTAIFGQEDGCKIVLEQMVDMDTESEHLVVIAEAED